MRLKKQLFCLLVATLGLLPSACNVVHIEPQPVGSGSITVNQSSWKSNTGTDNQIEATTSPKTDAKLSRL